MKMTINKKMNVGYIQLKKNPIAKTVKFQRNLLIDMNKNGDVVGIELLDVEKTPKLTKKRTSVRAKKKAA